MSDVSKTLEERGARYGAFIDHATICQGLIEVLHEAPNWWRLDPDMKQAMHVICDKMARCLNGDPNYTDNWHDMQGYARLVEVRLIKKQEEAAKKEIEDKKGQLFEAADFQTLGEPREALAFEDR